MARRKSASAKRAKNTGKQRKISEKSLANLKPFEKDDPRINRNGRPRNLGQLRELIQELGNESLTEAGLTRLQAMLRGMFASKNASDKQTILEYGFGKVALPIEWREQAKRRGIDPDELVEEFKRAMLEKKNADRDSGA